MSTLCKRCRWADWNRTRNGSLHPDGGGRCKFVWVAPPLPASMYWIGGAPATPGGGFIERNGHEIHQCRTFDPLDHA